MKMLKPLPVVSQCKIHFSLLLEPNNFFLCSKKLSDFEPFCKVFQQINAKTIFKDSNDLTDTQEPKKPKAPNPQVTLTATSTQAFTDAHRHRSSQPPILTDADPHRRRSSQTPFRTSCPSKGPDPAFLSVSRAPLVTSAPC